MAKKLKALLESNTDAVNDIDDLLKMQEPVNEEEEFTGDGVLKPEELGESEDEDGEKLDEGDGNEIINKELKESEDEEKLDEDALNAEGARKTVEGESGTKDKLDPDNNETEADIFESIETYIKSQDQNDAEIFESEDEDGEKLDENEDEEKLDENEDEEKEDTLSEAEQKIVMEALNIPASAMKELKIVFESMVANKVQKHKKLAESRAARKAAKIVTEMKKTLELQVEETVRQWHSKNKPIFEAQEKMKRLEESFKQVSNILKGVGFETSLNESATATRYSKLATAHNTLLERNKKLERFVEDTQVRKLFEKKVEGLSQNQKRRFTALAENLEYKDLKDLDERLETLRKLFKESRKNESELDADEIVISEEGDEEKLDEGLFVGRKEPKASDLLAETLRYL